VTPSGGDSTFGFTVRSNVPLRFLREGGGVETLEVTTAPRPRERPAVEPLRDWTLPGTGHEVRATLYQVGSEFEYWTTDVGGFRIDPARRRIEVPADVDEILREQRLWALPTTLCYMERGDLSLHAAAVEVSGRAVILAAPQRFGKTTLAWAFHRLGHRVLSEDLACCRVGPVPAVLPGPALLRMRPDVYGGHAPEGTHVVLERPDRVFLALDADRKGSSAPVPLAGIVFLRESEDGIRVEPAEPPTALADLWALNFRLPTGEGRTQSFQRLSGLAGGVRLANLYRPLRLAALDDTVIAIVDEIEGS
jgi:hypothetical protein